MKADSSVRDPGGSVMGLREHVICDSDLHVMEPPDLWERYIDPAYAHAAPRGLSEIHPRHAGAGQEPHDAPDGRHPPAASRGAQDRLAAAPRQCLRRLGSTGLGRPVAGRCHGRRGARPRRPLPLPRPLRARPRLVRADRQRRARARVRHRHRPGLQRLDEGLLRLRARPHVRCGHGGGPRRRAAPSRRPGAASRSSVQGHLPAACRREPPALVPPAYDPLWAESSGSACRWPSTAAARPT